MKTFQLIFLALISSLLFLSCSKDDPDQEDILEKYLKVEGEKYQLDKGEIASEGFMGTYYYEVYLHSSGIEFSTDDFFSGQGNLVMMAFATTSPEISEVIDLEINSMEGHENEFVFVTFAIDFDAESNSDDLYAYELLSGDFELIKEETIYRIHITGPARKFRVSDDVVVQNNIDVEIVFEGAILEMEL